MSLSKLKIESQGISIPIACVSLLFAFFQIWTVGDRIYHMLFNAWKLGFEPPLISAGTGALKFFLLASFSVLILNFSVLYWLTKANKKSRFLCNLSSTIVLTGAITWLLIVLSPYVELVQR